MRTKEELYNELNNLDLHNEAEEPQVSVSLQECKNGKNKSCVYFNLHNANGIKYRYRVTITLNASKHDKAIEEQYELKKMCQDAIHCNYHALTHHDLVYYMNRWINALENNDRMAVTTIDSMRNRAVVITRYFKDKPIAIEDVDVDTISSFCDWALDGGRASDGSSLSPRYVSDLYGLLREFLTFACSKKIIAKNPCDNIKVSYKKTSNVDNTRKQWMNDEEYKEFRSWLIEVSSTPKKAHYKKLIEFCELAIYTGARREELMGLKWKNIDFDKKELSIQSTRVRTRKKEVFINDVKTTASCRIYCLQDRQIDMLQAMKERQQSLGLWAEDNFIFIWETNERGSLGKEYRLDYITKLFKKAIMDCDVIKDKTIHLHNLRHSCCSIMFMAGYSLEEIQCHIGHEKGSEITLRVYNHHKNKLNGNKLAKLDSLLS